jgi:2-polyprenyl-3-methyl-5-hydroxy-6-metoxy-1,4-benzoquinol methylase
MEAHRVSACDVCKDDTTWRFAIRNRRDPLLRIVGITRADFWVCETCGLVRQIPKPPPQKASSVYQSVQFRPESAEEARRASTLARTTPDQYRWVMQARGGEPGTVLDVGAGTGALLDEFKQMGWKTFGIEPTPHFAAYASSLGHHVTAAFLNGTASDETYDLVTASHVLEHIPTPGVFLDSIRARMRPDSHLFVEVPDVMRPYGHIWCLFFSVNHVYHYTIYTLTRMLSNHGFHVSAVERSDRGIRALCRPGASGGLTAERVIPAAVLESIHTYRETAFRRTYLQVGIKDDLKLALRTACVAMLGDRIGDRIYARVRRAVRPRAGVAP